MASRSDELYNFLYLKNKDVSEIHISEWDYPDAFCLFVEFCMTGSVNCTFRKSVPLLYLACKYKVEELKIDLSKKIMEMISDENCFHTFRLASLLKMKDIEKRCHTFFEADPVKTVLTQPNLKLLPRNAFEDVLLIVNFTRVRSEGDHLTIYDSIIRWSKGNSEDFKSVASEMIFKYLDFKLFKGSERLKIGQEGVLDLMKLFAIQSYCEDQNSDISQFVPSECATLSTLEYKGIKMSDLTRKSEPKIDQNSGSKKPEDSEEKEEEESEGEDMEKKDNGLFGDDNDDMDGLF